VINENIVNVEIASGKYHEVKRLFGYIGNRVEELERTRIDELGLDELDLKIGEWKYLHKTDKELKIKLTNLFQK
jgi:16S rRNA pseudouridine516 synthase